MSKQKFNNMKKVISFSWVYALAGIALCVTLFAFTRPTGAHSVQVYLDTKKVIDQHVNFKGDAPKVMLAPTEKYNQLIVKYDECGRTVTGRKITVKDEHNKVLKDWSFEGSATGFAQPMQCPMKEVLSLKQKGSNTLKLYYSSNDFPEGQHVASLVVGGSTTASR
jgi:hypothetical protein